VGSHFSDEVRVRKEFEGQLSQVDIFEQVAQVGLQDSQVLDAVKKSPVWQEIQLSLLPMHL
jgi:hypothetical protein